MMTGKSLKTFKLKDSESPGIVPRDSGTAIIGTNLASKTATSPKSHCRLLPSSSKLAEGTKLAMNAETCENVKGQLPAFPSFSKIFCSSSDESLHLSTAKLKRKKKRRSSGNGLMFVAITHLLLACGLIDVSIFMSVRFGHINRIWPNGYSDQTISESKWFQNLVRSIRVVYTPVAVTIGLMIFFPKIIFLLQIFFAKVSFWRTATVDSCIGLVTIIYAIITGVHARTILDNITKFSTNEKGIIICYPMRNVRGKIPQDFLNECLLMTLRMFGEHLSLLSVTSAMTTLLCIIDIGYAFILYREEQVAHLKTIYSSPSLFHTPQLSLPSSPSLSPSPSPSPAPAPAPSSSLPPQLDAKDTRSITEISLKNTGNLQN